MIYFLSDAHLGSLASQHPRSLERRLVSFLDEIKATAEAVYLLGDMFDFWHEYKYVVPKGYTRFLGKLSELTDNGVEVHFFTGNHDIWEYGYLEKECGVIVHHKPSVLEIHGKTFFLAHGDGLGDPDPKFRFIKSIFTSRVCQWLFRYVMPPSLGMSFGLNWAKHSREKRKEFDESQYSPSNKDGVVAQIGYNAGQIRTSSAYNSSGEPVFMGEDKEHLVLFAKDYLKSHPNIDYFLFGHRHIELDLMLSRSSRMMILGDWITQFTYAVFDGSNLFMENYIEGETKLSN